MIYTAIDLFSGCGGLSEGLRQAGFKIALAIEKDSVAAHCYKENHPESKVIVDDISALRIAHVKRILKG